MRQICFNADIFLHYNGKIPKFSGLLDRKLRKKKGFLPLFFNYTSIIFREERGIYNGSKK